MNVYETLALSELLRSNTYPGRGIILGLTPNGACCPTTPSCWPCMTS